MKERKLIICPECKGTGKKWYVSVPEYERDYLDCDVCDGKRIVYEVRCITYQKAEDAN